MTSLKITMKTVQAVAHGTHIVTDVWLKTLDANSKTSPYTYPNEIDYTPAVKEENMTGEQFIPNPRRKQLFENHQFLFFDKEDIDIFSPVVSACAGTVVDCTDITDSKSDIISVVKQNKSPFVVALDPDDERFKDVVSDVNTKDSIIYSLLYATLDDHLKLSTLIPQHEATPLEPTPAPAPVLAGNFNGGNNSCNNDDDDDDDDDLFQDLFKKKGASTKTKSEHTQVPQTQQRKTQQPFYVQSVISQVEASLVDPTQQLFPSTAASSSSNVPESIPSKQSNLLASRLGFTSTPTVKPPPPITISSTAAVKVTAPAALPKPTQKWMV
ncbi:hypothetical protein BCR33DRAFT_412201 [Rhizoclosmatium globosum]|uniref:Uncharacterized protein n=1 Tax=Rhizoclosmatium globosum TaxID=329046 RepID=A0A1Y2BX97_9FUNG|nr:hypothetical protein BCR33DRAFT_412201 [Rhizoclosmatium globosum]|eukprot:ORY39368.1 hypothetical protein BCR33DRAFT_412201 [Rhizoclosmatium globosum]